MSTNGPVVTCTHGEGSDRRIQLSLRPRLRSEAKVNKVRLMVHAVVPGLADWNPDEGHQLAFVPAKETAGTRIRSSITPAELNKLLAKLPDDPVENIEPGLHPMELLAALSFPAQPAHMKHLIDSLAGGPVTVLYVDLAEPSAGGHVLSLTVPRLKGLTKANKKRSGQLDQLKLAIREALSFDLKSK